MDKYYIVSGIPKGSTGVGQLIRFLDKNNKGNCYITTYITPARKNRKELKGVFSIIKEVIYRKITFKYLNKKVKKEILDLKNEKIILIHPQTLGLDYTKLLIENNNVYMYIMDNSFFCIKSYNHLQGSFNACLECLGGKFESVVENSCESFPVKYNKNENLDFLRFLMENKSDIHFLTQNIQQQKLIKKHFGEVNSTVIGLLTMDMFENIDLKKSESAYSYDFVYHGANVEAKGILFVLELSKKLKDYSFFIPTSFEGCEKNLGNKLNKIDYPNVTFEDVTWYTGLMEIVVNSKIVLNPSVWSAPIEGALIKSIQYNGIVAVLETDYSFALELPNNVVLKLPNSNLTNAANMLIDLLNNKDKQEGLKKNSRIYVKNYLKETNIINNIEEVILS